MSFAVPVSYGMATSDTVKVVDLGVENPYSAIVVSRGCRSEYIKQDSLIDKNLPQDSLLSMVYGNVPSPDSADIYRGWSQSCQQYSSKRFREGWQLIGVAAVSAALGVTLTFVVDYEHLGTAILGRTFGIAWFLFLSRGEHLVFLDRQSKRNRVNAIWKRPNSTKIGTKSALRRR